MVVLNFPAKDVIFHEIKSKFCFEEYYSDNF